MDGSYQFDSANDAYDAENYTREASLQHLQLSEERLPFTVSVANNDEKMQKAIDIRQAAYARHMPVLAEKLKKPEPHDYAEGSVILVAESKLDGSPLGSLRIQTNRFGKVPLEHAVPFPDWMSASYVAHMSRLGIHRGVVGRVVRLALIKACILHCIKSEVDYMVLAARSPLDRQYEALLFEDIYPSSGFIPLASAGNVPHRIMATHVKSIERRSREADHQLYPFMFTTHHPDIDIGDAHDAKPAELIAMLDASARERSQFRARA